MAKNMVASKKNRLSTAFSIIVFSLLISACSSTTSVVKRWSDPDYQGAALKKILVIGIIKDDAKRRSFEQDFSNLITTSNRSGIASYTVLANLEGANKKEQVLAAVRKTDADGVLVVTLLRVSKVERDDPGTYSYYPTGGYGMYDYYGRSHSLVYNPGYVRTNTRVYLDTKLFSVATEKMIWSATTESFNASSSSKIIGELEKLVISDMQKSGMVK